MKKLVVSTKIDAKTYETLTQTAEDLNKSVSGTLRLAIDQFLVNHRKTDDNEKSIGEEDGCYE
jgi:hypothetical protein